MFWYFWDKVDIVTLLKLQRCIKSTDLMSYSVKKWFNVCDPVPLSSMCNRRSKWEKHLARLVAKDAKRQAYLCRKMTFVTQILVQRYAVYSSFATHTLHVSWCKSQISPWGVEGAVSRDCDELQLKQSKAIKAKTTGLFCHAAFADTLLVLEIACCL